MSAVDESPTIALEVVQCAVCRRRFERERGRRGRPAEHCGDTCRELGVRLRRVAELIEQVDEYASERGAAQIAGQVMVIGFSLRRGAARPKALREPPTLTWSAQHREDR